MLSLVLLFQPPNKVQEYKNIQHRLRTVISSFNAFNDVKLFEEYLQSIDVYDRVILITSGLYDNELLERVHQLSYVIEIYIHESGDPYKSEFGMFTKVSLDALIIIKTCYCRLLNAEIRKAFLLFHFVKLVYNS